jgi:predicted DNA-binding antitoxin AbrB/MazE fold protein
MRAVGARYEDGFLKPDDPLPLKPGEHVRIVIHREPDPARWDLQRLFRTGSREDRELAEAGLGDWADALDAEDHG